MPGKLCIGKPANNIGAGRLQSSKSFCEGLQFRAGGTLVGRPITDNPHEVGSETADAWDNGWNVADAAAPSGVINPLAAPCCSVPQNVVVDV